MYLGRYQQGQRVLLSLETKDNDGIPDDPDNVPQASAYNASGTEVSGLSMQKIRNTNVWRREFFLGSGLTAGFYVVVYDWTMSTADLSQLDSFQVVPGGNAAGGYSSMAWYERPNADYIVAGLENGNTEFNKNPYL